MKTLKIVILSFVFVSFAIIIGLNGCSKTADACATTACHNGGTCSQGACQCVGNFTGTHCDSCLAGYEGTSCNPYSAKFIGTYNGVDTCGGTVSSSTSCQILNGNSFNQILIYLEGLPIYGMVNGNTITIASQTQSGITFSSGYGSLNGNNLYVKVYYTNNAGNQTCTFAGTK